MKLLFVFNPRSGKGLIREHLVDIVDVMVKAGYEVKTGDVIAIAMGARTVRVEVLQVAEAVRKDDAAAMYRELPE